MLLEGSVRSGNLASTLDQIRSGADVNAVTSEGLTLLMIASGLGQPNMVELLLTAGAQVLALESRMGASAIHKAALSGNSDVVHLLLDHGAFIDQQSPILGHTALMDAVVYKHGDVVSALLKRGARTSIHNHWNETALDLAKRDGLQAIATLIEAKNVADTGAESFALVAAIKAGSLQDVHELVASGAPVNARLPFSGSTDDNYTPLAIAAREGHVEIVRLLLDRGANPRRAIGLFAGTALHEACYFGHADVVRVMTEPRDHAGTAGSELDAQGALNGMTPLHDAVWHGHLEAARVLVEAGARLDLKTHAGLTPRELAFSYGYIQLAEFLASVERN